MSLVETGERVVPGNFNSKEKYLVYLRHLFAYNFVKNKNTIEDTILEIGCGEGYGTSLLSKNSKKILGLDINKKVIALASKKYRSKNCIFKWYDGQKIPYKNNTFDKVISFQVIEHVIDDMKYISEIHRVLKHKGIFILTTPNRNYRLKPMQKPWNKFHMREYNNHQLEKVLTKKFSDTKIVGIKGKKEVQKIEIKRVKKILRIISFDPLNLRRLLPESLRVKIINVLNRFINNTQNTTEMLNKYSLNDYYIVKDNKDSLDLLGICVK